jgi:uncharacterized protein (TIGR02145 family)
MKQQSLSPALNLVRFLTAVLFCIAFVMVSSCDHSDETNPVDDVNSLTDIDGNVYKTVQIGNQIWMAEDLRVKRYNDGVLIPIGDKNLTQLDAYFDNPTGNTNAGLLYNLQALRTEKLCPVGWRDANDADWLGLVSFLASEGGSKLRSIDGWATSPHNGGTNSSGFDGRPNGSISFVNDSNRLIPQGTYSSNQYAFWWSRYKNPGPNFHGIFRLSYDSGGIIIAPLANDPRNSFCVRCIKG